MITAINNGGQSTAPIAVTTLNGPPTPLTDVSSNSITTNEFTLTWSGGGGATSYSYALDIGITHRGSYNNSSTYVINNVIVNDNSEQAILGGGTADNNMYILTPLLNKPLIGVSPGSVSAGPSTGGGWWTLYIPGETTGTGPNGSLVTPSTDNGVSSKSATFNQLYINASYTVVITAINSGGQTSTSYTVTTLMLPPIALTNVSSNSITPTGFSLTWSGGQGATSYSYELNGTAVTPSVDNGVSSKSATFTGLTVDTSYTVLITAINNGGSMTSSPFTVSTLLEPPTALTDVSSNSITTTGFTLTWSGGQGAELYSYELNGSPVTPSANNGVSSNSATFSQLTPNTSYTIIITATNIVGSTSSSYTVSTLLAPPTAITDVSAVSITQTGIDLVWSGGDGAESYSYVLNGSLVTAYGDNGTTAKGAGFSDLTPNTSYTIVVIAINSGGQANSLPFTVTTLMIPPTEISNVESSSITQTGFTITWPGGDGATSYSYELNGSLVTPSIDNGLSSKSATFTGLTPNTSYTIVVTAINSGGQANTFPITVTTLLEPPTGLTDVSSNSITTTGFTLTWSGGQGAESYSYELNGYPATPSADNGLTNSASFAVSPDTSYTVVITAINSGGQTSTSYTLTTPMEPPTALTDVSSNSITTTGFTLTWSGGQGAESYSYEVNGYPATPSADNGLTNSASFAVSPDTSYAVVITATNSGGSTSSSPYTLTTPMEPPTALTDITIVNKSSNLFKVSWSGAQNTSSYSYTIDGNTVTPFNDNGITDKSAVFAGLTPNTSYILVITAINSVASLSSSPVTVTLNPLIIYDTKDISHLVNNNINANSTELAWNGGEETTQYSLVDPNSGITVPYTVAFNTTNKKVTVSNINVSTDYSIILRGITDGDYPLYLALTPGYYPVLYSNDGFEWKNLSNIKSIIGEDYVNTQTLKYANGLWHIGSLGNSYVILYSYDGFNWNLSTSAQSLLDYCFVIEKNDISGSPWLAGGMGANCRLAYSYDGITWLPSTSANAIFTYQCRSLKWNGSMWLAGGYGSNAIAYSYDGINWVATSMPSTNPLVSSIEWLDGVWMYVNVYESSIVYYTTNASDPPAEWIWNSSLLPGTSNLQSEMLTYNGTVCFLVGISISNKTMFYSLDKGITWIMNESGNSIFTGSCSSIKWNGTMWIAGGYKRPHVDSSILSGHIAYSYDGINWIETFLKAEEIYIPDIEGGIGSYKSERTISFTTNLLNSDPNTFTASAISNSGFTISWSGGTQTSVYTYTLDNIPITPTIDNALSQQTATFTGLTSSTLYTVSISYKTQNEQSITSSVLVKTLP